MKKKIAGILAFWMLITALVSCSESGSGETEKSTENTSATENTEATETLTGRMAIPDNLPDKTFGGTVFTVCTEETKRFEIVSDESTGEGCNDAVYYRNARLGDRFDVSIETYIHEDPHNALVDSAISGDYFCDLAGFLNYKSYTPISKRALLNWKDIPYVDLTQPWHNQLANEPATINGKLFAICSDLSITALQYTYGIFFNYRLAEDQGHPASSLYQTVYEGNWTLDYFSELVDNMWIDTDGNGKAENGDTFGYGFLPGLNTSDIFIAAYDLPIATIHPDGTYTIDFFCERTQTALEKMIALKKNERVQTSFPDGWRSVPVAFAGGRLMMTQMYFGETTESISAMEDTYGILPLPKLDAEQSQYYTNAWDSFTAFGVPITAKDTEMTGILYEALSAETYKTVFPAYYDVALKSRYSAEPDVANMVDILMAGRKFDFTFQFGDVLERLPYQFREMLSVGNSNVERKKKTMEKKINTAVENMYAHYMD